MSNQETISANGHGTQLTLFVEPIDISDEATVTESRFELEDRKKYTLPDASRCLVIKVLDAADQA